MKTKFLGCSQVVAAFAAVLALSGGTAQAATCNVAPLTPPYPTIQSAVNDTNCSIIDVAAGAYTENVTIDRTLTLNGAQAGMAVAGRVNPLTESTVTGMITIGFPTAAPNVTIDGFSLTNPGQSTGILIKTVGDGAFITNNIIQGIGGVSFAGNTQAIYLENGPDDVTVVGNKISFVAGILSSNGGVFIGDSSSMNPSLNVLIEGNSISDITSTSVTPPKGAYGIHVNNGNGSTNNTGLVIRNNTIDNLIGGGWVHAIGLEANTPGVVVNGNSISNLVSPPFTGSPPLVISTAVAVWFEANSSLGTAKVNQNNFNVTNLAYGIAVQNALIMPIALAGVVDGRCNWWGDMNGPGPVGPSVLGAQVSYNVDFNPWLIARAPAGACVGGASAPAKVTGGGQIPGDDPLFSPLGDLLSVPALIPSLADPNAQATFGFVAKCCRATGNLEYNDHQADVRIKAQSIEGPIIRSQRPGDSCPTIPGSKHATIGGRATVISSTSTTTEDFTVEVDDCGEPGTADTFGIKTDSYSNGWPFPKRLIGGNIQIH